MDEVDRSGRAERAQQAEPAEQVERTEQAEQAERAEQTALTQEEVRDRLRRRAAFLRELAEARELRRRVTPRRSRRAQAKAALRMNTFRGP